MAQTVVDDRRASRTEVLAHRDHLLGLAGRHGLAHVHVRADGALVVTAPAPGYRPVARFVGEASRAVGAHVYVVTDDTEGAGTDTQPL